jgi:hypothetical protein
MYHVVAMHHIMMMWSGIEERKKDKVSVLKLSNKRRSSTKGEKAMTVDAMTHRMEC